MFLIPVKYHSIYKQILSKEWRIHQNQIDMVNFENAAKQKHVEGDILLSQNVGISFFSERDASFYHKR